jgi:hypothetical protein
MVIIIIIIRNAFSQIIETGNEKYTMIYFRFRENFLTKIDENCGNI